MIQLGKINYIEHGENKLFDCITVDVSTASCDYCGKTFSHQTKTFQTDAIIEYYRNVWNLRQVTFGDILRHSKDVCGSHRNSDIREWIQRID